MDDFGVLVDPYIALSQRRLLYWNLLGMKNGRVWNLDVVAQLGIKVQPGIPRLGGCAEISYQQ
jgi:hypothetical protein